jgi:hypothetical protein
MTPISIVRLILLIFALGCFLLGSKQNQSAPGWNLVSLGLAFLTASFIPWPL